MVQVSGDVIQKALAFIDNLKDERGASYCEIAEDDPNERKVFPQSQYLPYVTFKGIGREDLAEKIAQEHDFGKVDTVDLNRDGRPANDSFCVLEGNIESFRHAGERILRIMTRRLCLQSTSLRGNILCEAGSITERRTNCGRSSHESMIRPRAYWKWTVEIRRKQLHSVFKVALFGILAKRKGKTRFWPVCGENSTNGKTRTEDGEQIELMT